METNNMAEMPSELHGVYRIHQCPVCGSICYSAEHVDDISTDDILSLDEEPTAESVLCVECLEREE